MRERQDEHLPPACDVCIVGAGAAGLWAASRVTGRSIVLLEKMPRTGTKVLASGGTRCNLTTTLAPEAAGELFGPRAARFLRPALRALSPAELRARFFELGVPTVEAPLEKIFPESGRARDVRDALERAALASGARIHCDQGVRSIERTSSAWRVNTAGGAALECASVIVCPGGASYPRTGTTGEGYAWLAELGLPIVEPVPALVPLTSPASWVRELTGIAVQDVIAKLVGESGTVLGARQRPILFTHRGVSGPGAMDLSAPVARAEKQARRRGENAPAFVLRLDLQPSLAREALRARLIERAGDAGAPRLSRALDQPLPARLLEAVARQAQLPEGDPRINGIDRAARHRWIEALKGLDVPVDGTLGFDHAEVTSGGLALTHVDPGTMQVRGFAGLYACGEILDVDGPIGGLNFQAAFATAELAARAVSAT